MLMWLVVAILFILFFIGYPYAIGVLARRRMLKSLARDVRRAGGKIRFLKRFPSLSGNFSKKPDVWIRCGGAQYVVKLWIPKHHRAELYIRRDGKAREVCRMKAPLSPHRESRMHTAGSLWRSMPTVKSRSRVTQSSRRFFVLLLAQPYHRLLLQREGRWHELHVGDRVLDKVLHTPTSFVSLLQGERRDV